MCVPTDKSNLEHNSFLKYPFESSKPNCSKVFIISILWKCNVKCIIDFLLYIYIYIIKKLHSLIDEEGIC